MYFHTKKKRKKRCVLYGKMSLNSNWSLVPSSTRKIKTYWVAISLSLSLVLRDAFPSPLFSYDQRFQGPRDWATLISNINEQLERSTKIRPDKKHPTPLYPTFYTELVRIREFLW